MHNLTIEDVQRDHIVLYNEENLLLIEPTEQGRTFIEDDQIDAFSEVFLIQRWKVEIIPKDKFGSKFVTHRRIKYYIGAYEDVDLDSYEPIHHTESSSLSDETDLF